MRLIAFLVLCISCPAISAAQGVALQVCELAHKKVTDVEWNCNKLLIGDVNCDGQDDYVIEALTEHRIHIAIVLGPLSQSSRVEVLTFGVGNERYQDSLSEKDPTIQLAPLDYDPKEMIGSSLEGYQPSKSCKDVTIGGELSDEIHVYWNHKTNNIGWWRL